MSAFKNKFVVALIVFFFCGPLMALNKEYQDGLNSFRGKDVGVMFGKTLLPRLQSRRNVQYYVVTTRSWTSGSSIFQVSVDDVGEVSALLRMFPSGDVKDVDLQSFGLFADTLAFVSDGEQCYLYIPGDMQKFRDTPRFVKGRTLRSYVFGELKTVLADLGVGLPDISIAVKFRFCNGMKVIDLGTYELDDCVDGSTIDQKIRPVLQTRKTESWKVAHQKRLNRKPKVKFGSVARVVKDHKGNFTIPYETPPVTATSHWQEVVYEYHTEDYGDHWEEWSIPVGTIEHEKVKTLTRMYDYNALRKEAERFEREMEEERNATPPDITDGEIAYELEKGVLLLGRSLPRSGSDRTNRNATKGPSVVAQGQPSVGSFAVKNLPKKFFGVRLGSSIGEETFVKMCKENRGATTNRFEMRVSFVPPKSFLDFTRYYAGVSKTKKTIESLAANRACSSEAEAKAFFLAARYHIEERFNVKMLEADKQYKVMFCSVTMEDSDDSSYKVVMTLSTWGAADRYWTEMKIARKP